MWKGLATLSANKSSNKPWFVYLLRCADDTFYAGITTDTARRVDEHNQGGPRGARYTRSRRPVKLIYSERWTNRSEAGKREAAVKRLSRAEKQALVSINRQAPA